MGDSTYDVTFWDIPAPSFELDCSLPWQALHTQYKKSSVWKKIRFFFEQSIATSSQSTWMVAGCFLPLLCLWLGPTKPAPWQNKPARMDPAEHIARRFSQLWAAPYCNYGGHTSDEHAALTASAGQPDASRPGQVPPRVCCCSSPHRKSS